MDLVKQPKVAQILGDEKGVNRRGSKTSLGNNEQDQNDEVSLDNNNDNIMINNYCSENST